jgi:NAD(P)H-flavin reductase
MENQTELMKGFSPETPMIPTFLRVKEKIQETHDTWTLVLENLNGARIGKFSPGQFNMLYAVGVGEIPISISGDCHNQDTLIHTIRDVGNVSHALCQLNAENMVGVRGPFGSVWPMEKMKGKDVIIVGGGIGLAPLRPAIYHVLNHRNDFNRLAVAYGARAPKEILFPKQIMDWRSHLDLQIRITVDVADQNWHGQVGVVTTLIPRLNIDPENGAALVCGPEVMIRFVTRELLKFGIPADQIWISMERNMKCGIGLCGHCQLGPEFICKDGPVFNYTEAERFFRVKEL